MIFVDDFQQLLPVGDAPIYEAGSDGHLLVCAIEHVIVLKTSHRQEGNDQNQLAFQTVLKHCQEGQLDVNDWDVLKKRFIQTAPDSIDPLWDSAPHLYYDNQSSF